MKKGQTKSKTPQATPTNNKIDLDEFFKSLLTEFFEEAVELMHPKLHAAVDWTVPAVFLEQELINALKGRFKIKDKRKFTDKLARLRLKTGKDYYIITHVEAHGGTAGPPADSRTAPVPAAPEAPPPARARERSARSRDRRCPAHRPRSG